MPPIPIAAAGVQVPANQLDVEIRKKLEQALLNWGVADSEFSRSAEAFSQQWDDTAQPLIDQIGDAERLSQDDFAIRINARD